MVNIEKKVSRAIYNVKLSLSDGDQKILEQAYEILADVYDTLFNLEDDEEVDGIELDTVTANLIQEIYNRANDVIDSV